MQAGEIEGKCKTNQITSISTHIHIKSKPNQIKSEPNEFPVNKNCVNKYCVAICVTCKQIQLVGTELKYKTAKS